MVLLDHGFWRVRSTTDLGNRTRGFFDHQVLQISTSKRFSLGELFLCAASTLQGESIDRGVAALGSNTAV